jgi:hypothetical protein
MRRKGDENLFVEFYMGSVEDKLASERAGHPVHVEKPFVRIHIPGDAHNIVDTQAKPYYQQRFADEWRKFQDNQGQAIEGWLLKTWPIVNAAQVKNLEFLNIHTVEQLAGLTDSQCQKVGMGSEELRMKARAAVEAAKDGAVVAAQAAENKRLSDELEALKSQIAAMSKKPRKEEASA